MSPHATVVPSLIASWFAALLASAPAQSIQINEALSSNSAGIIDEDGDHSDWIEIVNRESASVNLEGWGLSDSPDEPFRWTFGDVTIPAGGRLLVWASGKDRPGGQPTDGIAATPPDQVPGLVTWLKADAETFASGTRVQTWTDRSGLGNHGTQSTAAQRPLFVGNAVNGLPAMRFTTAQGEYFRLPTTTFQGMSDLLNFTALTVTRWTGSGEGLFGAWDRVNNNGSTHFELISPGQLRLRVSALDSLRVNGAVPQNTWTVVGASMNSTGDSPVARGYVNGALVGSRSGSAGEALLSDYGSMGIGHSHETRPYSGDIAEFVLFNRELLPSERAGVEKYLQQKYGLIAPEPVTSPHTNFAISANGETLTLTRPDGSTADSVPVPALPANISYGRSPDATGSFAYFLEPTPEAANTGTAYGPPVGAPTTSHRRGFYTSPFSVTLSHPDPGVSIYYTTNGNVPKAQSGTRYTGPIAISRTTVLRAAAIKENALPVQNTTTQTYLFLSDVAQQQGTPQGYPTNWGGFTGVSYGISPAVKASPGYATSMQAALTAIPTLSLVIPVSDMFSSGGVYASPVTEDLERAVSAEWIHPNGAGNFQIDAGLRVQGGASREFNNTPKKSLRLLFKSQYGPGRLEAPIFKDQPGAATKFNTLVLRGDYNNSWLHWDSAQRLRGTYVRDQWMRDTQIAMSGIGSHSNHVHLYINGIYWGLYNPSERPDAAFAATYFGGEREDYDAMTHSGVRDGDRIAWDAMMTIARSGLASNANYEAIQQYLNVDHFIDYMLLNLYGGNWDWPDNNWNAVRKRAPGAGYLFFAWDAERSLEGVNDNRVGVSGTNSPGELYSRLRQNAEFRLRFADRARIHLFDGGALTPAAAIARMQALAASVETAVYGEQARWGAYRNEIYDRNGPSPRYTRDNHWQTEKSRLLNTYFPQRTAIFLNQLRSAGLYPNTASPTANPAGGEYTEGSTLTLSAPQGTIYYTTDGSDPRVYGTGAVSGSARVASGPILLTGPATVKARALHNGEWSAVVVANFTHPDPVAEFLPTGDADWTINENWNTGVYPNAAGAGARIPALPSTNRDINLRGPVTIGRLLFDLGSSTARTRVRDRGTGNTLAFNGGDEPAVLRVDGDGTGFVEFEFDSEVTLATDLELRVHNTAGDSEHGALRLRTRWEGPGGLIKKGPGIASLTGEDKNYSGDTVIEQGVLQVTQPAAMVKSAVTVQPGGQLRLVSAGTFEAPRIYTFGGVLSLAGPGRSGVLDGSGQGVLGALRYQPGSGANRAVLANPVSITATSSIHVDGSANRLDLSGALSGSAGWTKSGGGTLALNANSPSFDGPITVSNGHLEVNGAIAAPVSLAPGTTLSGHGRLTEISGAGTVALNRTVLRAFAAPESRLGFVLGTQGWPNFANPASSGNGTLVLSDAGALGNPAAPRQLDLFLPAIADGAVFRGGLFVPSQAGLRQFVKSAAVRIFVEDAAGEVTVGAKRYAQASPANAALTTLPHHATFSDSSQFSGEILELRLGGNPVQFAAWQARTFTNPADLANPAISGPLAAPFGDRIPNLLRYALDLPTGGSAPTMLPGLVFEDGRGGLRFRFDPGKLDIAYIVEASSDMIDWSRVLFDSRTDRPDSWNPGTPFTVLDSEANAAGFYRLRILEIP